jgi:hypothetical protein
MPDLEEQLLAAAGVTDDETPEVESEVSEETTETTAETPAETTPETAQETTGETPEETPAETQAKLDLAAFIKQEFDEDFSGKYQNDRELLKGLVHAAKKIGERNDEAQMGRWIKEKPQEAYAWLQSQIGQQQQQQQPPTNGAPEYNPEWAREVEVDEYGRAIGVKPGYDPATAQKFNRALDYYHQQQRELVFHPEKVLQPYLAQVEERAVQKAREQWEQEWNARYGQMNEFNEAQQVLDGNKKWLFNEGDPQKGWSAAGRVYNETVQGWSRKRPDMTSRDLDELGRLAVQAKFPQPKAKPAGAKPGVAKTTNVQRQTQAQELKPRPGEDALAFITRIDQQYNMIPE